MVHEVEDLAEFNQQLEDAGDKLVLLDFFATWYAFSIKNDSFAMFPFHQVRSM